MSTVLKQHPAALLFHCAARWVEVPAVPPVAVQERWPVCSAARLLEHYLARRPESPQQQEHPRLLAPRVTRGTECWWSWAGSWLTGSVNCSCRSQRRRSDWNAWHRRWSYRHGGSHRPWTWPAHFARATLWWASPGGWVSYCHGSRRGYQVYGTRY